MAKRFPIDLYLSGAADASGECVLQTGSFKAGGLLCVQRVSVRCVPEATLIADISFERAGTRLFLDRLVTTVAGEIESMTHDTFAPSDYGVRVDFSSVDAGDLCEAWVYGYWTDIP